MSWLPLTTAQQGLFFAHALAPDNPAYSTAEYVVFDARVDPGRLESAINAAYREFEQLRTVYRLGPDGPQQRVLQATHRPLPVLEVTGERAAEEWMHADLARPMDPLGADVVRSALLTGPGGRCWWYQAGHHLVLDGYGAQQLVTRIAALYGGAAPADPLPLAELVAADPGGDDPQAQAFWDERLATMSGVSALAGRTAAAAPRALRCALEMDQAAQQHLVKGARRLGSTWADLVTAAVGSYAARMGGLDRARIGIPLMNRSAPGIGTLLSAHTVCTAMNVLPATLPGRGTVAEALAAARAEQQEIRRYPFLRQEELARRLQRRDPQAQLFGLQLNLIPFGIGIDLHAGETQVRGVLHNLTAGPVEDMTIGLRGTPGRGRHVRLEVDANPALYDSDSLPLHLRRLLHWIITVAGAQPEDALDDLPPADAEELHRVVTGFNRTGHPHPAQTLQERFDAQVRRTPDATALIFASQHRSYRDLHARAGQVAAGLRDAGVRPGDVVGVALERGFALFEAIYGVLAAGAVYLPLDPDLPAARIDGMLADACAAVVITADGIAPGRPAAGDRPARTGVDAPAYVLFTSGSTGRPKGVVVSHRAIDNRLAWMQHRFALAPEERVLHKTPISFDVSVWELFWPLQVGASVVIAEPGAHRDPRAVAGLVTDHRISTLHFVPSMLRELLADRPSRIRLAGGPVRNLVTSGEALPAELAHDAHACFGVPVVNLYGPTEAAVDVTAWECSPADETIPIGRPIWNTSCYVLDPQHRPVPIGVAGELWLGGVQLAEGYVGRPELTAQAFLPDLFRPGGRMYRTGDVARWRPDGALLYLGRGDDQVKLRGQRLELGEVEAVVGALEEVTAAAAGMIGEELVVWYVPAAPAGDPPPAREQLSRAFGTVMPPSFQPHHWVPVDRIPLTPSGKTDRRTLARTFPPRREAAAGSAGPGDLTEQRVCAVIAAVLGLRTVDPDADFFTLGGDSLRVLRVLSALQDELGVTLALGDVFAQPTAAGLARLIDAGICDPGTSELLTLRPGSTTAPLFLLPPAGGLGWCYTGLLRFLPAGLGVHTIQAPGLLQGRPEPAADLQTLARRQLRVIRQVVGDGGFHVAGWSLGGMAAQAVAALARADGQDVGAVVLLDAYPSDQWRHLAEPSEAEALVGLLRLGGVEPPGGELDRATAVRLLRESGSAVGQLPEKVVEGCVASVIQSSAIVRGSAHDVLDGDLTVIVAGAPRPETWVDPDGWRPYVGGLVEIVELAATHGELLRPPFDEQVGATLTTAVSTVRAPS